MLETLTYSCITSSDLHDLSAKLDDLTKEFLSKLPKSEGLVLQPNTCRSVRRRAQRVTKKYKALPLKIRRGRVRSDQKSCWCKSRPTKKGKYSPIKLKAVVYPVHVHVYRLQKHL